ncbi:MAG: hypothetical protein AAB787_01265 [Patescibacteria group bacterium]
MPKIQDSRIWRLITDFWTVIFLIFIIINFASADRYEYLIGPFSALYIGVLTLYVGSKEFDRWYEVYNARHPGEIFVYAWSLVVFGLFIASLFLEERYKIPSEVVACYVAVLSIFAITQKSKHVHDAKKKKK